MATHLVAVGTGDASVPYRDQLWDTWHTCYHKGMAGKREPEEVMSWIEDLLEVPMVILSLLLLVLLAIEFLYPLTPGQSRVLTFMQWGIWVVFVIHFVVTFSLAPDKRRYLRRNWLIVISLVIPYFRVFRIVRAFRAIRALNTARLVTLTNRAVRQLGFAFQAQRIFFVILSSIIVDVISAVGVFFLERNVPGSQITSFGTALWFATRSVMNADVPIAPVTPEGRFLGVVISLYGFAIFGVVTGSLASWFMESDRRHEEERRAKEQKDTGKLSEEIHEELKSRPVTTNDLRRQVDRLIALLKEREQAERQADEEQ